MNIEAEKEVKVQVKLSQKELDEKYQGRLPATMEGKYHDVLSQLFKQLVGIKKILITGEFRSSRGAEGIGCSVKASEGYLYPLKNSLVFIHKPVYYIKH